jgi:hypothetical protein
MKSVAYDKSHAYNFLLIDKHDNKTLFSLHYATSQECFLPLVMVTLTKKEHNSALSTYTDKNKMHTRKNTGLSTDE